MTAAAFFVVQGLMIVTLMLAVRDSVRPHPRCCDHLISLRFSRGSGQSPVTGVRAYRSGAGSIAAIAAAIMVALCIAPTVAAAAGRDDGAEAKRVVFLNATDPYLPAFIAIDGALRKAINTGAVEPVELYTEALDMYRFPRSKIESELVTLLRKKYDGLKVDVVIAGAEIALEFVQRNLDQIWPGAMVVFVSVPANTLRNLDLNQRTIGVPVTYEQGKTLDLALKLLPATQRIAVVAGAGEADSRALEIARPALERYAERLEIDYLVGLTIAETIEAVQALPAHSLVLYLIVFRDGAGKPQVSRNVLRQIAAVSPVPVFGAFETYLGSGIVAGSITSYGEQGRLAGELVLRLLHGEDPATLAAQPLLAPGCIADWQQLKRWGIDPQLLPADCELRFRDVTVWDQYRWQITFTLAAFLIQALLIVALLLNRRKLGHAQQALLDEHGWRTEAETITASLRDRLGRFSKESSLGTMATSIAHEINQPLIAIQNYAQALKRRFQAHAATEPKLIELVGKIEGQAERAGAIVQRIRSLVSQNEPELRPVMLSPLLQEVIHLMEPECQVKGCRIDFEPAIDSSRVFADALQIQLVLVNLLHNAMDSVHGNQESEKPIVVDVRVLDDNMLQVSVTDGGGGVSADMNEEIFEPHYSGKSTGMGMGLAICRDIISAHGGLIWCEPNPGGGAIFRFTLRKAG